MTFILEIASGEELQQLKPPLIQLFSNLLSFCVSALDVMTPRLSQNKKYWMIIKKLSRNLKVYAFINPYN